MSVVSRVTPEERKVLVVTTFIAACLCFAPMQWASGGALLVLALVLGVVDVKLSQREEAALEARRARDVPATPDVPPIPPVPDA